MDSRDVVTLDHIRDFFDVTAKVEPLDLVPTATGGLGIDNIDHNPQPSFVRDRKGTEYAQKYIEEEERLILEGNANGYEDVRLDPETYLPTSHFELPEETSTAIGDACDLGALDEERAQEIYTRYCKNPAKYSPDLPISNYRNQIVQIVNINQVVVIQGATGCGKTTQVPQYILDDCAELGRPCNIVVTQPRKIAAVSVARRVCQERNWTLGTVVGYQVAMDRKASSDTCITYMTTGVLLQKLVNTRRMDMYTHVIIDEIHERDQDTDFALLLVKKLLRTNSKSVKLILMSATMDTSMFANYFAYPTKADAAPVVDIIGKTKEVTEHYIEELSALGIRLPFFDVADPKIHLEVYDLAVRLMFVFDKIERCEQSVPSDKEFAPVRGAVLAFLPGYDEITKMKEMLKAAAVSRKYTILPLHSSITVEEQSLVFRPSMRGYRKVILATNIAESSITVPDVKYVIDFCLTKSLVCDQETNYTCLQLEWASKANCVQRKGRAGRVDIGRVYRMIPRDFYEKWLYDYSTPEMKRCPLTQTVLQTKKLDFGPPQALLALALDPPALSDIENAILVLKEVGALTVTLNGVVCRSDGDLTFVGHVMSLLPLDVNISKLIIYGYIFDCLEETIIIAASLSLKSFFSKPFQKHLDSYKSKLSWADGTFSDCLAYLYAYKCWKNLSTGGFFNRPGYSEKIWAEQQFIQLVRIKEVDQLVQELKKRLERVQIQVSRHPHRREATAGEETLILKVIIAGAFFPNYFAINSIDEKDVTRELNNCNPLTTVVLSNLPSDQGMLYFNTIREMMACCSPRVSIVFEGRKAYVQFERQAVPDNVKEKDKNKKDEDDNSIVRAVYYAVKMRQMRRTLELQAFSHMDAEKKIEQYRTLAEKENPEKRHLKTKRMTVQPMATVAKKALLPTIHQMNIKIFISYVITPGHFWARYVDQRSKTDLLLLENFINDNMGQNLFPIRHDVKCGMLVLAPYYEKPSGNRYYRATVQEIISERSGAQALVFFIDYGNTSLVRVHELRQLDTEQFPDWIEMPAFAFECQLSCIRPSTVKCGGEWSKEAKNWFREMVTGRALNAQVYSVINNVVRLELHSHSNDTANFRGTINEQLVANGFAEIAEESYLSKVDNEARYRYEEQMSAMVRSDPGYFAMQFTADSIDCGDIRKTAQKIRLHGPSTPLEVTFYGNTRIDYSRSIRVDEDSVNSVTLNPEPQDKSQQFIVAASVSLNQRSNTLKARSTTLMPKIPGLQGLVCLLFAPTVELRTDPERKVYTGAICGLGYDPESGGAIFPDHDMEIAFETIIDYDDISNINAVRTAVIFALGEKGETGLPLNNTLIHTIQSNLRKRLLQILRKKREIKEVELFRKMYSWLQVPDEYLLRPELPDSLRDHHLILQPHNAIDLCAKRSLESEMKEHLEELRNKASRSSKFEEIKCKICGITVGSRRSLLLHLDSREHNKNVEHFFSKNESR